MVSDWACDTLFSSRLIRRLHYYRQHWLTSWQRIITLLIQCDFEDPQHSIRFKRILTRFRPSKRFSIVLAWVGLKRVCYTSSRVEKLPNSLACYLSSNTPSSLLMYITFIWFFMWNTYWAVVTVFLFKTTWMIDNCSLVASANCASLCFLISAHRSTAFKALECIWQSFEAAGDVWPLHSSLPASSKCPFPCTDLSIWHAL